MKIISSISIKALAVSCMVVVAVDAAAQGSFFGGMSPNKTENASPAPKKTLAADKPNARDAQGRRQGEWAEKYSNGQYKYVATFRDDKPVGKAVRYQENGKKLSETTYNENGSAYVVYYHENGQKNSEGLYDARKKRDGKWTFWNERGVMVSVENYKSGKLDGKSVIYYESGKVMEEMSYVDDVPVGAWKQYLPSGKPRLEATYVKGKLDGVYKFWGEDGYLSVIGYYKDGVQIGDWKVFEEHSTQKFYVLQYDMHGHLLNADEVNKRAQSQIEGLDERRNSIVDPEDFMNNPEDYRPY